MEGGRACFEQCQQHQAMQSHRPSGTAAPDHGAAVCGPAAVRTDRQGTTLLTPPLPRERPPTPGCVPPNCRSLKSGAENITKRNFWKFSDSNEDSKTGTADFTHAAPDSGALSSASLTLSPSGPSENGLNSLLGPEAIFHSSYSNLWSSLNLYLLCLAPLHAACRNPRAVIHSKELIILRTGAA